MNKPIHTIDQQVQQLLQIRDIDFTETFYNNGVEWLEIFTFNDKDMVDFLVHSRIFWEWWRQNWRVRNRVFLQRMTAHWALDYNMLAAWKSIHNPKNLGIFPTSSVFEESVREMGNRIIEQELVKIEE